MTTVTIVPVFLSDDGDSYVYWMLKFIFKSGNIRYRFNIDEPYLGTKDSWLALAEGRAKLYSYGDGGICPCDKDKMKFACSAPGDGTPYSSTITIPIVEIADKLTAAIEEADRLGYLFAEKEDDIFTKIKRIVSED